MRKARALLIVLVSGILLAAAYGCEQAGREEGVTPQTQRQPGEDQTAARPEGEQPGMQPQAQREPGEQPPPATPEGQQPGMQPQAEREGAAPGSAEIGSSEELIGQSLYGQDGQEIGKVETVYTSDDGRALYVILEGREGKMHPIPIDMVRKNPEGEGLQAQFDAQVVEQSPSYDPAEQPNLAQEEWDRRIHGYYQDKAQGGEKR